MGKYDKLIDTLQPLPVEDVGAQTQVNKEKDRIKAEATHTPESLAKGYQAARFGTNPAGLKPEQRKELIRLLGKEGLEGLVSEAQKTLTAYEQLLTESEDGDEPGWGMYGAKPNAVKMANGATLRVQREPTAKVEDKESYRLWCIAEGLERSMMLHPSTTLSMVKQRFIAGQPTPAGVSLYSRPKIVFVKPGAPAEDE